MFGLISSSLLYLVFLWAFGFYFHLVSTDVIYCYFTLLWRGFIIEMYFHFSAQIH